MRFSTILVVCNGNICRSPVGAALLNSLGNFTAESAGLNALINSPVDTNSLTVAKEISGLDVGLHRARQLDLAMIGRADLVLAMTNSQRLAITQLMPSAIGKTMLFGRWLCGFQGDEISDPFGRNTEVYERVHVQLVHAAESWCKKII